MPTALERLRARRENRETPNPEPTKPTKPGFVGFGSTPAGTSEISQGAAPTAPAGAEQRRARALAMLDEQPQLRRAAIFDATADRLHVVCALAIRDVGTCEFLIPQASFDPWATLASLESTQ